MSFRLSHQPASGADVVKKPKKQSKLIPLPIDFPIEKKPKLNVQAKPQEPSLELWGALYELAAQLKKAAPWKLMEESDIFAVVNPNTHEKAYCSVMGHGGEFFAIAFYLGDEGFRSFVDLRECILDEFDLVISQKCLMLSWEDNADAHKRDKSLYKQLGLKFRGRNQYPLFRILEPGFEPWFIDNDHAQFLKIALPKVLEINDALNEDFDCLLNEDGKIPCFTLVDDSWEQSWIRTGYPPYEVSAPELNELKVRRFINEQGLCETSLEIDYFYLPGKIKGAPKPYYPRAVMVVDESGPVVAFELVNGGDLYTTVQEQLCTAIERIGGVPKEILVLRDDLKILLEHYSKAFGFKVVQVDYLEAKEEAMLGLASAFFGNGLEL